MEIEPSREPLGDGIASRIRQRAILRAISHAALLLVPVTYAFVTWLQ